MQISELHATSLLILGLGQEGRSSWRFLRAAFPEKVLGVADQLPLEQLSPDARALLGEDQRVRAHLGPDYLSSLADYEIIVRSPGIPLFHPALQHAAKAGKKITSQTAIFFANFPGAVIGITGTKGKSTTASLAHAILRQKYPDAELIGNIGAPALDYLPRLKPDAIVVYELSSHQLEGLSASPHIAVLLNIVPEHLDYYLSFEQYVAAKANITRSQTKADFLIYDADHEIPRKIAAASRAARLGCSLDGEQWAGSYLAEDHIVFRTSGGKPEKVVPMKNVPLLGRFNLMNVAAAVVVGKVLGVANNQIADAVRKFQPLEHRLEWVGIFAGVTYYNDSIATVPEATIAALDTLGSDVETLLLGGTDRHLDFSGLAQRLAGSSVKTLILFPATGERIWQAACEAIPGAAARFKHFFVETMERAVALAKQHTAPGKICLLSPASPSFGLFRDYRDRGSRFKHLVQGTSEPRP
ncbi:MAG: UDP-N-acetylmuramoyl-L-alanine--D-glutamate ligase [Acidobacteria bacterium]|nr:UDP-N-acetylmuramoyl-L-alanine--D-glutamate ligase [Acidobacteriota bacterium]